MARTIAVANQKGGLAKTTSAVSLAVCWIERGLRVLLVDADAQTHLTVALGADPHAVRWSLHDVLVERCTMADAVQPTAIDNLALLPAAPQLAGLQADVLGGARYEFALRRHLAAYGDVFDVIVIDAPPAIGCLLVNVLTAADLVLVPVPCEPNATTTVTQTLQIIQLVRDHTNPTLERRIALTMVDKRTRSARLLLDRLQRDFPDVVCGQSIGVEAQVAMSQLLGRPDVMLARRARATHQYRSLADEVLNGVG